MNIKITLILIMMTCVNVIAQDPNQNGPKPPPEIIVTHLLHLADSNNDQATTSTEWKALLDQLGSDGEISHDRIREYLHANRPKNRPTPNRPTSEQRQRGQGQRQDENPEQMNREFLEQKFQDIDRDGDGTVSHSDLPKPGHHQPRKNR